MSAIELSLLAVELDSPRGNIGEPVPLDPTVEQWNRLHRFFFLRPAMKRRTFMIGTHGRWFHSVLGEGDDVRW